MVAQPFWSQGGRLLPENKKIAIGLGPGNYGCKRIVKKIHKERLLKSEKVTVFDIFVVGCYRAVLLWRFYHNTFAAS